MKRCGRGFKWSDKEEKLLIQLYNDTQISDIAKIFNKSIPAIFRKAYKLGLKRKKENRLYNKIWSEQDESYLITHYSNGNIKEIAKTLNRTMKAILERAKLLKITRNPELVRLNTHKYTINENFFKTWSDEMAYILGFIWTDGNMSKTDYAISITQHKNDKYILEKIYEILGCNKKILEYKNKSTCVLSINNKIIYKDLKKLGLTPKKSKTVKIPINLPSNFIPSFLRGVLDGDGSVKSKSKRIKISTASKDFSIGLSKILSDIEISHKIHNEPYLWKDEETDFFNILILRKGDVKTLFNLMYKDSSLYLKRKYQEFINMGILNNDFNIKCKNRMRKIIGISECGEKIFFNNIKEAKHKFPNIYRVLKSGNSYRGFKFYYE